MIKIKHENAYILSLKYDYSYETLNKNLKFKLKQLKYEYKITILSTQRYSV